MILIQKVEQIQNSLTLPNTLNLKIKNKKILLFNSLK